MVESARPGPRVRLTQAERRRQTRNALLLAALDSFARDGYHAANLEAIAAAAGYSKGAVYSNFANKAELFLAVMDYNLEAMRGDGWDPLRTPGVHDAIGSAADAAPATAGTVGPAGAGGTDLPEEDVAALVRGVALATLEFIATAARDETLVEELRRRQETMVDGYRRVAADARPSGEALAVEDLARLMTALDQGASILTTLGGSLAVDGALLRAGMLRLVDPARAADPTSVEPSDGGPHPDVARVAELLREDDPRA